MSLSFLSLSFSVFLSPSKQSAYDSAWVEEMDGVSIFRSREGGKSKVSWGEGERERVTGEEGCEEKINLHSTAASGQRQLEIQSTLKGEASSAGVTASHLKNTNIELTKVEDQ